MINDVKCDQCGHSAIIIRCTPISLVREGTFGDQQFRRAAADISCKISCPNCGTRTVILDEVRV